MLRLLLRDRILHTLLQFWWLPSLVLPLLWMLVETWTWTQGTRPHHCYVPLLGYSAAIAGIVGVASLHASVAALRERFRHELAGHRFLCPHCLRFGEFRFACGACGCEVEALTVLTRGIYVNDCSHCGARLFSRSKETGEKVWAWCWQCSRACEREIHHERQVRVVGTLRESDFTAFCAAIGVCPVRTCGDIDVACHDDGVLLTVVLAMTERRGEAAPLRATHVLWSAERIWLWLDGTDVEPLKLGEIADRFLHRARLSASERRRIVVGIRGELSDVTHRLLTARFGTVVGHVAPVDLIGVGVPHV